MKTKNFKETRKTHNRMLGILIDLADEHLLDEHTWKINHRGYPVCWIKHHQVRLHQLVVGVAPKRMVVDHINHNKLDNRRDNLRHLTYHESNKNRRPYSSTGYKHVYKNGDRFRASIQHMGKTKSFRRRDTIEESLQDVLAFKRQFEVNN